MAEKVTPQTYTFKIQTITPVHVGSGNVLNENTDFFYKNGAIGKADPKKILEAIGGISQIPKWTAAVEKGDSILDEFPTLKNKPLEVFCNELIPAKVPPKKDLKEHIRNELTRNPLLPGSSIKGAIRSALLSYFIENSTLKQKYKTIDYDKDNNISNEFLKSVFGEMNNGTDFMRFIQVYDAEFKLDSLMVYPSKVLSNTGKESKWKDARKFNNHRFSPDKFVSFNEVIRPNAYTIFRLKLNNILFLKNKENNKALPETAFFDKKREIIENPYQFLFKIINQHSLAYLQRELQFYNKYNQAEFVDQIINHIKHLLNQVINAIDNGHRYAIFNVGQGVGFHAITGDWKFETHLLSGLEKDRGKVENILASKTRRLFFKSNYDHYDFYLPGFVKVGVFEVIASEEEKIPEDKQSLKMYSEPQKYELQWKSINNLKQGDIVDAIVIGKKDLYCLVNILVKGVEKEVYKFRYASGLNNGTLVQLRINQISGGKKGKPKNINEILGFVKITFKEQ
ncbi:MAG: hypothetical protein Kow0079_17120 [Vicingaceae bacterium]